MRFAFIADRPGWAFDRTGQAMLKYGQIDGVTWDVFFVEPLTFKPDDLMHYDLVRVGGLPLFLMLYNHNLIVKDRRRYVPTIASFWDIDYHLEHVKKFRDIIAGVIINDIRFRADAMAFDRPIIYSPDKVDADIFYARDSQKGPVGDKLRAGWAGSEHYWPGVKNVSRIADACERAGWEFARQDREKDGLKNPQQMREWYATLDVYVALNIERSCTPVPVLEALSCGVPVITTRCGDLWPMIEASSFGGIMEEPSVDCLAWWLKKAPQEIVNDRLTALLNFTRWDTSEEAQKVTAAMKRLAETVRAR